MRCHRNSAIWAIWGLLAIGICGCGGNLGAEPASEDRSATSTAENDAKPKGKPNRLAGETSPYLLLHAHNPVDWFPWGPEAFEKARDENKPIFLSIGYSSCYWCHVMERLVFENEDIAKAMNEKFVCIKVDREERPDIDDIYMTALLVYLQATGSEQGGGWPLSMFLTPEGKPIAGGTYFPPEPKPGLPSFPNVLKQVDQIWTSNEDGVRQSADTMAANVRRVMQPPLILKKTELKRELVTQTVTAIEETFDQKHGGVDFSANAPDSPKFPVPVKLSVLQYAAARDDNEQAGQIVQQTLEAIVRGGIHDHLGGGFHRYSTDRQWHVPHFEKMLYDQAQLADVLLEAYRTTGQDQFRRAAEGTYDFVLRELTDPAGGFYSALDAETDGVEGQRYVWTKQEIETALGEDDAKLFAKVYGLNQPQTFEHGYVLHQPQPLSQIADELGTTMPELERRLAPMRKKLLAVRDQRPALLKDDKVLTSWNGLMIRSLAHAGKRLGRADYRTAAEKAALFVLSNMRDEDGRLQRTYRDGQSQLNAYLDDYAFMIEGLLALYETTKDQKWLRAARRLTDQQIELFQDEDGAGFYFTPHHHEELLARTKNANDAVLPSGNSVSIRNLLRLSSLTDTPKYQEAAEKTLQLFASQLADRPRGMANMALALGEYLDNPDFAAARTETPNIHDQRKNQNAILQVAAETSADQRKEIVTAQAYLNVDKLPAGSTCEIVVFVDIKPGWHINQNPAVPKNLIPTKFTIKSDHGITVENLRYPDGEPLAIPGFDESALVYEGSIVIRGTIRIPQDINVTTDEMHLAVRYQPCNDKTCLAPKTAKLVGQVPIARPGEQVRLINQNLFPRR